MSLITFLHSSIPHFKTRKHVLKVLAMRLCGGINTNLLNSCFAYQDVNFISPTPFSFGWIFLYVTNTQLANVIVLWRPRTECKFIPMQTRIYCSKAHKSVVFFCREKLLLFFNFFDNCQLEVWKSGNFGSVKTN